jgi:hypothetical protein
MFCRVEQRREVVNCSTRSLDPFKGDTITFKKRTQHRHLSKDLLEGHKN